MTRRQPITALGPRGSSSGSAGAKLVGLAALSAVGVLTLVQVGLARRRASPRQPRPVFRGRGERAEGGGSETRELHGAAALLALSVLADSAVEHYRGSFENPGMYTPLITSSLTLLAGIHGVAGRSDPISRRARAGISATAAAVGAVGTGFHIYNILRRPGGLSWLNLFYSAPAGAPAALSLAGLLGLAADRIEGAPKDRPPRLVGLPAGRVLAALTGLGIAGTTGEVGLLHFRGAFQNPFMFAPVTIPPVASVLLLKAAVAPRPSHRPWLTRSWLDLTAVLGFAGVGFHAYGVSRAMGGWRNWSQNVVDGPPLPAPPSFSALSLAGLAALSLLDREDG